MSEFYSGHLFEEEVLGRCLVKARGHMRYREAREEARANQPSRKKMIAKELERSVGERLGGRCVLYTAIRSAFDFFHGVDGWFEFDGRVVTIDLTMDPNKEVAKADLVIQKVDLENLPALADRIAREFSRKRQGVQYAYRSEGACARRILR